MVWMEDNICIYRYGEILHTSAVLVGTIHVIQGIYISWREAAFSSVVCKQKVCLTTKRRMVKEMPVVGGPNSTDEGMNKINTRGKSRENCSSQFWPAKLYQSKSSNMSTGQQKSPHFQRGLSGSCKNNKCIKNQDFLYLLGHSF